MHQSQVLLESELSAITDTSGLNTQTFRLHYQAGAWQENCLLLSGCRGL